MDYGPDNAYRFESRAKWQIHVDKVARKGISKQQESPLILDANRRHLLPAELRIESFRQHVDDIEDRHLGDGIRTIGRRFPKEMKHHRDLEATGKMIQRDPSWIWAVGCRSHLSTRR